MESTVADQNLAGKKIAILVANGFAETQLTSPQRALIEAGAKVKVISPEQGLVNGWHDTAWGHYFPVDEQIDSVLGSDYDMLMLPGGKRSIAKLVQTEHTARIIKSIIDAGKPVAAIGDGVGLLAFSERASGRRVTGAEEVLESLEKAGAEIAADEAIVHDGDVLTARDAEALDEFVEAMLNLFAAPEKLQDAA